MDVKVLVLGGAGYIGSHMVASLQSQNIASVVIDDLSTGFANSVAGVPFYQGDFANQELLQQVFKEHQIDAVMHFAASSQVGESVSDPEKYYFNNLCKTQVLLNNMRQHQVINIVFSSTAAVYGSPQQALINEQHPVAPMNPYGRSKLAVEWMLQDYASAYGIKAVCLRYFNAAGAAIDASNGERHDPETHLIPLVLQALSGRRQGIKIFGTDYATPDGTCIRDYIHILDLAQAHLLAMNWLLIQSSCTYRVFNLGNGAGFSVRQVIATAKEITGQHLNEEVSARRVGDPAILVASAEQAKQVLDWKPQYTQLQEIITHAWAWEQKLSGL
jgi:UDP-glucose 4-epimerase